ncbi:MAG: hypothetical protein H0W90_08975 [Actinobacteria bacterium]|nr:hypothetical protein [Actinomycetota bacterium]
MSLGLAVFLLALVVLVALAGASFFRHTVAALFVLLALPLGLLLQAALGLGYSVFVIGLLATAVAVIHTIADTLRLLRAANRPRQRPAPARSRSDRSRIAA